MNMHYTLLTQNTSNKHFKNKANQSNPRWKHCKTYITPRNRFWAHLTRLRTAGSSSFPKLWQVQNLHHFELHQLFVYSCLPTREVQSNSENSRMLALWAKQKEETLENKANQSNVSRWKHCLQNNRSKNNAATLLHSHMHHWGPVTARSNSSLKLRKMHGPHDHLFHYLMNREVSRDAKIWTSFTPPT